MKKRILAAVLSLVLLTTGCASMLEARDYFSLVPHNETVDAEGNSSILRVESYQELVSAILYFVDQGQETGVLHLYNYVRDVDADLTAACLEVAQEDPLGAYALDFIKFEVTKIVSYHEAELTFSYRRTPEQVDSIVSVTGTSAIRQELQQALAAFDTEVALRIGYFDRDADYLQALLEQAYYDTPQAAFGLPQAEISVYPDTGYQRVVEFQMTYAREREVLEDWQGQVVSLARQIVQNLPARQPRIALEGIYRAVRDRMTYDPQGQGSIQALLADVPVRSEGLALAVSLVCREAGLSCQVVRGSREGAAHFWTVVDTGDGYRHMDPTLDDFSFYTDDQLLQMGYQWDSSTTPVCLDAALQAQT